MQLHHGTHAMYVRGGCRCEDCTEGHRLVQASWQARVPGKRGRAAAQTAALECRCGGLLAEDDHGRVFCLACEPQLGEVGR